MNKPLSISNFRKTAKVVLFLLILFGINQLLVTLYSQMTASSILARRDVRFRNADKTGVDILVLGDSHAYSGITASPFKTNPIKWVAPGEGYMLNYYKLEYGLKQFKPKIVILPLDLHSFSSVRYRIRDDSYWVKYADYLEVGAVAGKRLYYAKKYVKGRFFPYVGAGPTINDWAMKDIFKLQKDGMMMRRELNLKPKKKKGRAKKNRAKKNQVKKSQVKTPRQPRAERTLAQTKANMQFRNKDYFHKPMVTYFKKILSLCRENDITVLLVKYPVSRDYYQRVSELVPLQRFNRQVRGVLNDYDNYFILDFQNIFFSGMENMRDVDHVNKKGSRRISRKIAKFIEKHKLDQ